MRICRDCGEAKELIDFYRFKRVPITRDVSAAIMPILRLWRAVNRPKIHALDRSRYPHDRERKRAEKRMRKYGIAPTEYDALLLRQGQVCPVCALPFEGLDGVGVHNAINWMGPSIDHDHETGRVRGILHRRCNLALEFLLTEAEIRRARAYLRESDDPKEARDAVAFGE